MARTKSSTIDRAVAFLCWTAAATVCGAFGCILIEIVQAGYAEISWEFLTARPRDAGRAGGIGTVLVSTGLVLAVCLSVSIPVGVGAATWLSEFTTPNSRGARFVTGCVDLLASVPSIIFGLFGMVFFSRLLDLGLSILSGGLTLACMVLPVVIQTTHAGLRSAPDELRRGAAALGLSRTSTLWHLLFPAAIHGVVAGLLLSLGRAMAETAALIFTSGYATRMPESLLDSGRTLSVHIYDLALNVTGGESRAYASASLLLGMLLVINLATSTLADLWLRKRQVA
ncbi:MAG: phosphate ABC transporter permease PstA [Rhodopirellula sp.]|nr:phosphate ABC transporter permease PstA [Rhodopirellula sp.]